MTAPCIAQAAEGPRLGCATPSANNVAVKAQQPKPCDCSTWRLGQSGAQLLVYPIANSTCCNSEQHMLQCRSTSSCPTGQGHCGCCARSHCNTVRWPLKAADSHTLASHGHGVSCARNHWPVSMEHCNVAAEGRIPAHLLIPPAGWLLRPQPLQHCQLALLIRDSADDAGLHTRALHGQGGSCARSHCRTACWPCSAAQWQASSPQCHACLPLPLPLAPLGHSAGPDYCPRPNGDFLDLCRLLVPKCMFPRITQMTRL